MNELFNKSYLFFQTSTAKALSCTEYETVTKIIIPQETFVATPVAHAVKVFIIMV
jgi:ABC-type amino acid transport system permease subunit